MTLSNRYGLLLKILKTRLQRISRKVKPTSLGEIGEVCCTPRMIGPKSSSLKVHKLCNLCCCLSQKRTGNLHSRRSSPKTDRQRLHRKEEWRVRLLHHLRSRLPFGALEVRTGGLAETDESHLHLPFKILDVN